MRRLLVPAVAVVLLTSLGCATGPATAKRTGPRAGDYQPLAIGNQWTYSGKMQGQQIDQTITIKGMKDGYFADDANGLLRVDAEGLRDDKRYLLREPIERGKAWSSIVSVSSTERYEIADTGFTVNTPAGSFNDCVLVKAVNRIDADKNMRTEWTFAPGVGIVRMAFYVVVAGKDVPQGTMELKSFKRAPAAP